MSAICDSALGLLGGRFRASTITCCMGTGRTEGPLRPRSHGCRLARRSGHLVPVGTRAAPFRPRGQSGLARIQLAPAPPSAEEQGADRVVHDVGVAGDPAGCATGETRVSADLGQDTSRRAKAGPAIHRAARGGSYTPPKKSGCFGPAVTTTGGSTKPRASLLATSTSLVKTGPTPAFLLVRVLAADSAVVAAYFPKAGRGAGWSGRPHRRGWCRRWLRAACS